MLEKTLESPLDSKVIKPVNPEENQPWIFIGRIGAEVEALILWPPDVKSFSWLEKTLMLGKTGQEENGATEDEMVGWHHWLSGHEFEPAPGDSEGREAWCAAVHGVAKIWTQLSDWTTTETKHLWTWFSPSQFQKSLLPCYLSQEVATVSLLPALDFQYSLHFWIIPIWKCHLFLLGFWLTQDRCWKWFQETNS